MRFSMTRKARYLLAAFDRAVPAIALALVLMVQGLVASGAADSVLYPALTGPDGRTATASDICNSTGEPQHAGSHCGACTQAAAALLPQNVFSLATPLPGITWQLPQPRSISPRRFEAHARMRRGPPVS